MSPAPVDPAELADPAEQIELVPLRWWHLRSVLQLEHDLFGAEQWSEEAFWSELAYCPPTLVDGPFRRYWAAVPADAQSDDPEGLPVLGYAGVAVASDEAYVQTIGVAVPVQRRGIGRELLQQLLDDAWDAGGRTCWLEVRADNAGAQGMYERFGFSPRGRRRGYYQPSGTDAIVMSVDLPARTEHR
ncbi:MAG TPA: ribosomal protein S18-alanine N-acetyltransferase [Frankiaceae bacterium]|nr:ribosomal protein S18-alanine N-acetyltransferase [Frankiaceae bacterium]